MKVAFITGDTVWREPSGRLTGRLASTRLRLILARDALASAGDHGVVLANAAPDAIAESEDVRSADVLVFGKIFADHKDLIRRAKAEGKRVVVDLTDDPHMFDDFIHIRNAAKLANAIIIPTEFLAEKALPLLGRGASLLRVPDALDRAVESPSGTLRPSGERLELVWYGSPTNAAYLNRHIQPLLRLASKRLLRLTMVSQPHELFDGFMAAHPETPESPFVSRLLPWSEIVQREAVRDADLVLLPTGDDEASAVKSANRLVYAIAAGRLAVATPLPAYKPLADFALLVDDLASGVEAALALPAERIEQRLSAGQAFIKATYGAERLGKKWVASLRMVAGVRRTTGGAKQTAAP